MLAADSSVVLTLPLVVSETLTPVSTWTMSVNGKLASSPRRLYQVGLLIKYSEIKEVV